MRIPKDSSIPLKLGSAIQFRRQTEAPFLKWKLATWNTSDDFTRAINEDSRDGHLIVNRKCDIVEQNRQKFIQLSGDGGERASLLKGCGIYVIPIDKKTRHWPHKDQFT